MAYKLWTVEEENLLRELVGKMSFKDMSKKYFSDRHPSSIQTHSRAMGLNNSYVNKIHTKDENFWSRPNPINSYFAGNFAADGHIYEDRNKIRWEIAIKDIELLKHIIRETKTTNTIKYSTRTPKKFVHSRLEISGAARWISDIKNNFNLCQNKTHILSPPKNLSDYLNFCYLIGYIDGDGTICFDSRGRLNIRFVSASPYILKWIKEIIDINFPEQFRLRKTCANVNRDRLYYSYLISGIRAAKLFVFLRSFPVPKFSRKWNNPVVIDAAKKIIEKYNNLK